MAKVRRNKDLETTPLENTIYVLLINPDNPKFPGTQTDVCNILEMSKSTVHDNVKRLVQKQFIREKERIGKEIYYRPGKYKKLIEMRISIDNIAYGAQFGEDGRAITPISYAELRKHRAAQPYRPLWDQHLNGGWLMFTAIREGHLEYMPANPDGEKAQYPLFGDVNPYNLPGSLNWNGVLEFDGSFVAIRYQRTSNGKMFLYITPGREKVTAAQVTPDEDLSEPFMDQIAPILEWLEEEGDWRFLRKDDDTFDCLTNFKNGKNGQKKEYGADEFMSELFRQFLEYGGVPGKTPWWFDNSPGAMGPNGEIEFNRQDYVEAVDELPETKLKVDSIIKTIPELRREFLNAIREIREDLLMLAGIDKEQIQRILDKEEAAA